MANDTKFREDSDLAFLQFADHNDLAILAHYLIKDSEGKEQWTGQLKRTICERIHQYDSEEQAFKNSWMAIAAELQLYGGDTVVNIFRRKGVVYKEIAQDVASRVGVDFHKDTATIEQIEEKVLRKLFGRITTFDDRDFINKALKEKGYLGFSSLGEKPWETIKNGLGVGAASASSIGGVLGVGIKVAKNFIKINPAVAVAALPLTAQDITAPAYRVTIPAVCIVAMMRLKHSTTPNKTNLF